MITIGPASPAHIGRIATRMRDADRRECEAFGRSPKQALRTGLKASSLCWTGKKDGRPGAMFGATSRNEIEGVGIAWFLGTDEVFGCARELLALGPAVIEAMHRRFRRLENLVSSDNEAAIRLLGHWGFEIGSDTMDVNGVEFRPFWRETRDL
jgi:hypothetical protein